MWTNNLGTIVLHSGAYRNRNPRSFDPIGIDNNASNALSLFLKIDTIPIIKPITPKPAINEVGRGILKFYNYSHLSMLSEKILAKVTEYEEAVENPFVIPVLFPQ